MKRFDIVELLATSQLDLIAHHILVQICFIYKH